MVFIRSHIAPPSAPSASKVDYSSPRSLIINQKGDISRKSLVSSGTEMLRSFRLQCKNLFQIIGKMVVAALCGVRFYIVLTQKDIILPDPKEGKQHFIFVLVKSG